MVLRTTPRIIFAMSPLSFAHPHAEVIDLSVAQIQCDEVTRPTDPEKFGFADHHIFFGGFPSESFPPESVISIIPEQIERFKCNIPAK